MSRSAVHGSQDDLGTDTEVVLVEASRASATVDFGLEDGVEGADSASSHEGEVAVGAGKGANTAAVDGIAGLADALSVGDDLVGSTSEAVSIGVSDFVSLALTDAGGSLENFALRTYAAVISVVDEILGADGAVPVDEEAVGQR